MADVFTKAKRRAVMARIRSRGKSDLRAGDAADTVPPMSQVTLNVPETIPAALHVPLEKLGAELLLAAAMKLYEAGRLSGGAAAALAGIPRPVFLDRLAGYGVPAFRQGTAELRDEAANA
jgi:predicted HTH domain antitoxin